MRYAIISDIHSNLEALQAVFEYCRYLDIDTILCLGDIVGYGANPRECLAILQKVGAIMVAGNHDWAVSGKLNASYFPNDGKEAIFWTRNQFSFEEISFLNSLNLIYQNHELIITHSSLHQPEVFTYLDGIEKVKHSFAVMKQPICFIGHTHIPKVYVCRDKEILEVQPLDLELNPDYQYIVNVGSVGQPRDGVPMTSFCLYDTTTHMIELKRVEYDINTAQKKIIEADLPDFLTKYW
jgi:putative phosphoesterase